MPTFEIRPLSIEAGYSLSCEGVITKIIHERNLISAVLEAAVIGRDLAGEIRIYDGTGVPVEVLPLPTAATTTKPPLLCD